MKQFKAVRIAFYASFVLMGAMLVMLVGTTFAWFSDSLRSNNNTLTAGNVSIVLSEATVQATPGGNLVEDPSLPRV